MRYTLREIPHLLRNPVGRYELSLGQLHNLWPLLRLTATLYRRGVLRETRFLAVAGSLGKSTTMRAVAAALGLEVPHVPPTNSWSKLALSILSVRRGSPFCVLEVGISRTGDMGEYARMIRPDVSVITSIAGEHHRSLGTLEGIRFEKADMVRCQQPDGIAVLNGDDPNVLWMATQTSAKVMTYGFGKNNDVRAEDLEIQWPRGNRFSLRYRGEARTIQTRLFGRHMVYPILAGFAAGMACGRDVNRMLSGLEGLCPTSGRMELVELAGGARILKDDYKSTLETIHSALDVLPAVTADRKIVVLGEVEDASGSLGPIYREIGRISARHASKAILVCSGNSFRRFRVGAAEEGMEPEAVIHAGREWYEAFRVLEKDLSTGDVVLIKGRRTQRLGRILLSLQGRHVRCRVPECKSSIKVCYRCPMLDRGWDGLRITV